MQADEHLLGLSVEDLPGVGWSLREQLHGMGIFTVADVRQRSCSWLQQEVGQKKGLKLWDAAHGKDDRCAFFHSSLCLAAALHFLVCCFFITLWLVVLCPLWLRVPNASLPTHAQEGAAVNEVIKQITLSMLCNAGI